jgi:hypothetical protein
MAKDILGREITTGCRVAYPTRRGATMRMRWVEVLEVRSDAIVGLRDDSRPVLLKNLSNLALIDHC